MGQVVVAMIGAISDLHTVIFKLALHEHIKVQAPNRIESCFQS
jgi:hypothetical protein